MTLDVDAPHGFLTAPDAMARLVFRVSGIAGFVRLFLNELTSPCHPGWRRTLHAWRQGFDRLSYVVYRLDTNDPSLYLSSYAQYARTHRINRHYDFVINDKLVAGTLLEALGVPTPALLATIRKGKLRNPAITRAARTFSLEELLEAHGRLVMKPIRGLKGKGLLFVEKLNQQILVNGQPVTTQTLADLTSHLDSYLVVEFVQQATYARHIFPRTTNTLRILTLWDYDQGRPFVAASAQRIGSSRSYPVDNWRAGMGGMSAAVDLTSGVLGPAAQLNDGRELTWHDFHPETKQPIAGVQVPHWRETAEQICEAARRLAFAPGIAWDVAVTEKGFSVLELNGKPGLHVIQVHRPLLQDAKVRRFYKAHKVIK